MFGLFSRKKQQSQCWNSSEEFFRELGKQKIPLQVMSTISFDDKKFEDFVPVMENEKKIWKKFECQYFPDIHESKFDCLKYITAVSDKGKPQYFFEVFKNVTGTDIRVNIINLRLFFEMQSKIFKACKDARDTNSNIPLDISLHEVETTLRLLPYNDFIYQTPPPGVNLTQEVFTSLKLHNSLGIFLKVKFEKDGVIKFDNMFKIYATVNYLTATVSLYNNELPPTYSKEVNIYKEYGSGWNS